MRPGFEPGIPSIRTRGTAFDRDVGHATPLAALQIHNATCVRVAVLEATVVFTPGVKALVFTG